MSQFHVNQIGTQLEENYRDDFGDQSRDVESNLSRMLAARAIDVVLGSSPDERTAQIEIVDGDSDHGIDAVGLDRSAQLLVLVQSKWRGDGTGSMDLSSVLKFLDGVRSLLGMHSDDNLPHASPGTRSEVNKLLRNPGARIRLVTATTASHPLSQAVAEPIGELLAQLNDLERSEPIAAHIHLDQSDFFNSLSETPATTIDLELQMQDWGRIVDPMRMYYGRVNASEIAGWYRDHGARLFADNIRVVLPRSDINDGIYATVRDEPQSFGYYNNGITIISTDVEPAIAGSLNREVAHLRLKGASIVNGAQTVSTLGAVVGGDYETNLGSAFVLVRCIQVPEGDETLGRRITRYANTQNEVSTLDFAFLDPEQHRLAAELQVIGYEYILRSAEVPRAAEASKVIHVRDAAVALACANVDPSLAVTAKREVSRLFSVEGGLYATLFNPSTDALRLLRSALVVREVDRELDEAETASAGMEAGVAVHGRRLIAHIILRDVGDAALENPDLDSDELFTDLQDSVRTALRRLLGALPSNIYPATFFKNQARCIALLEEMDLHGSTPDAPESLRLF